MVAALFLLPAVHAELSLDSIQFDPAIIASGDRVDIVVQFHDAGSSQHEVRIGNPAYRFAVQLESDASLTQEYVLIEDREGDDLQGIITKGGYYNKRFTVKIRDDAPAGSYEFKLSGQWYKDGQPIDSAQYLRFTMPVKKQGIVLSVANVVSTPQRIRAGDKQVLLTTSVTNAGEKTADDVRISLTYPQGIASSYTNDNRLTIGTIEPGQTRDVQFYLDTDRRLKEGVYDLGYMLAYQDAENNGYSTTATFPIVIKKRPDVVVTTSEGAGRAGDDIELRVTVQNRGEETADAVDVRILAQSSQPFSMDVRSDYVGRLVPGENATAVFTVSADRAAEIKDHKFTVIVRAKGDAEEGDDNVYTNTDSATVRITGGAQNRWPIYAGALLVVIVIIAAISAMTGRKSSTKRG
jgi:hypothetical protein